MKLVGKIMGGLAGVRGGHAAVALCAEDGSLLPGQISTQLSGGVTELGTLTVTFAIDGDDVRLEPSALSERNSR